MMSAIMAATSWGNHEMELLAVLAGAANRFWKNYDPSQPDTAAKSEAVSEWIRSQKRGAKLSRAVLQKLWLKYFARTA